MEMQMEYVRQMPTPQEIKEKYPLADTIAGMKRFGTFLPERIPDFC